MITGVGGTIVFLAGVFIGVIVLFDTSLDELVGMIMFGVDNIYRLFPIKMLTGLFKTKKSFVGRDKPIAIKGSGTLQREISNQNPKVSEPIINRKEVAKPIDLSEKLVSNSLAAGIWEYPALSLLSEVPGQKADRGDINKTASVIEKTLQSFGIDARVVEVNLGPAVTQYALEIALGTKVSKITSLANDLALATEAPTGQIRIEAPIPGRSLVGIEIPNRSLEVVTLRTMLSSDSMRKNKSKLSVALGLDVSGNPVAVNIAKMPHILIAGTTGSGKSVTMNC